MSYAHQDWEPVVLRKRSGSGSGAPVRRDPVAALMSKLADTEIAGKIKVLSAESVQAIVNYRREHNLTQKQMDQQCSFPAHTINNLEAKKTAPTPGQLRELNRLLKTGLTLE
jgi:hypothetical protein